MTPTKSANAGNLIYLDDGRTGDNVVISGLSVALGQNKVALSGNTLGHSDSELAITHGLDGSPDGSGDGDEGSVDVSCLHVKALAGSDGDLGTGHDGIHGVHGEGGEGLHGKHAVAGGAFNDEGGGDGVNLVEVERVVECLSEGNFAEGGAQVGAVAGLSGEDAAGGSEVCVVHDVSGSTEVSADSDT